VNFGGLDCFYHNSLLLLHGSRSEHYHEFGLHFQFLKVNVFDFFSGVVVQVLALKIVGAGKLRLSQINFSSELRIFHHLAESFSVLVLGTIDVVEDLLGSDLHKLQELLLG
jgi:hypothetical protein